MEQEGSLLHSQVPTIRPYPEPARSSPCPHITSSRRSILILSSPLHPGLPSGLFPSSFSTKILHTSLLSPISATCPPISFFSILSRAQEYIYIYIYTGCPGRNVPDFEGMFLKLKYTDLTKYTYIRSWRVTEIMAREKCGLLAVSPTLPGSRDVLPVHCACPSFSLQPAQEHSRCDCTCKVLGTLRTTATLVRVFM